MSLSPDSAPIGPLQPFPQFEPFTDDTGARIPFRELTREQRAECARRAKLKKAWRAPRILARCLPIEGTRAASYLAAFGLHGPYPTALRYHPAMRCKALGARLPVMLGAIAPWGDPDAICGFLTTWFDPFGPAPLVMPRGCRFGLFPPTGVVDLDGACTGEVVVARSIVEALAAGQLLGLPAVAAMGANGFVAMAATPAFPPHLRRVVIASNGRCAAAARLRARLRSAGIAAEIERQPSPHPNWRCAALEAAQ